MKKEKDGRLEKGKSLEERKLTSSHWVIKALEEGMRLAIQELPWLVLGRTRSLFKRKI